MKAAAFDFIHATSLDQALMEIGDTQTDSKIMGGSQSLGPMLNLRLARPARIVDISGLSELRQVQADGDFIRIGAGITHAEIEDGVFAPLSNHPWKKIAANIAYRAVRNRGTIGGSIAHADPAADWVLAASAVNAEIEIASMTATAKDKASSRVVKMNEFMIAAYTTILESNDMIVSVRIPAMQNASRWGYYKFCRKIGEFAEASCAAYFDADSRTANIVIGALDGAPRNLSSLAASIAKHGWAGSDHAACKDQIGTALAEAVPERDQLDRNMYSTTVLRCLDRAFGIKESA